MVQIIKPSQPDAAVPAATDPLESMAQAVAAGTTENTDSQTQDAAAVEAADQMHKLMAGIGVFSFKVFKALRQRAARNLPELLEHVTDADLQGPADALPPVLQKHLAKLTPLMGQYPEELMLLLSFVPLGMGYMAAVEHHAKNTERLTHKGKLETAGVNG